MEYEIDSIDTPISHCHCRTCQKAHAAPFATTAGVLHEHFHWLNGEGKLSSYESSPGKLSHLCSVRGSHVVAKRMGHPRIIIRVVTLDVDPGITPQMHIWISHDAAWLRYDVFPAYIRNGNRGENEGSYRTLF